MKSFPQADSTLNNWQSQNSCAEVCWTEGGPHFFFLMSISLFCGLKCLVIGVCRPWGWLSFLGSLWFYVFVGGMTGLFCFLYVCFFIFTVLYVPQFSSTHTWEEFGVIWELVSVCTVNKSHACLHTHWPGKVHTTLDSSYCPKADIFSFSKPKWKVLKVCKLQLWSLWLWPDTQGSLQSGISVQRLFAVPLELTACWLVKRQRRKAMWQRACSTHIFHTVSR